MTDDTQTVDCPGQLDLLTPDDPAVARATDPETSWDAAASLTPDKLARAKRIVLSTLQQWGPLTDQALVRAVQMDRHGNDRLSPSGIRTRRRELTDAGLVRDTGDRHVLESGRRAIVWTAS